MKISNANFKNALFLYIFQITLVISNFVTIYFISNNYSPEIYAIYLTNKSLAVIFAIIGSMGISFVSIKLLTLPQTSISEILSSSLIVQLKYVSYSFGILFVLVMITNFKYSFAVGFFITYVLIELRNILYSHYHAQSNFSYTSKIGIVSVAVYTLGSAFIAINSYQLIYIVYLQLFIVSLSILYVFKYLNIKLFNENEYKSKNKVEQESKKMVLTSASLIVMSEIEIVFLSFFTQGKLLGLLALTRRLLEIGSQTFSSLLDIAYPKLTKNIKNLKKINKYVYLISLLLFVFPIILFLDFSFVQIILEYFLGDEFLEVLKYLPGSFLSLPFMFRIRANIIIARSLYIEKKISLYILISSFLILIFYLINFRLKVIDYEFIFLVSQVVYCFFTELSIYREKKLIKYN